MGVRILSGLAFLFASAAAFAQVPAVQPPVIQTPAAAYIGKPIVEVRILSEGRPIEDPAAAALIETRDARDRAVAVQYQTHFTRAEKQIIATLVGHQKAEAFVMADHPAGHHVHAVDQGVQAAPVLEQLPVTLHRPQPAAEGVEVAFAFDMQGSGDGIESQRLAAFLEAGEHRLATWHRKFIGAWFTCGFVIGRHISLRLVGLIRILR